VPLSDGPSSETSWWIALRDALRYARDPLAGYSRDELDAIEGARAERNLRRVHLLSPITLAVHLLLELRLRFTQPASPREAAWRDGVLLIEAFAIAFALWNVLVTHSPLRRVTARYRATIGEWTLLTYALWGGALSANAQRFHGSFAAVFASLLIGVTLFQVGTFALLASVAAALLTFAGGTLLFQESSGLRATMAVTAIELAAISLVMSRTALGPMAREVTARFAAERAQGSLSKLNSELERRVAEQVQEILARVREVEALNKRLAAEVRERSRELSAALEALARNGGAASVQEGAVLAERFEIQRVLGAGGMGAVYLALDHASGERVAIKLMQSGIARSAEDLRRFLREGEVLASLDHPGIVRTVHVGITDFGLLFLALELVEGVTVQRWLQHARRGAPGDVARVASVVADAHASAHAAGVVHRDVKPSNLMLTRAAPGVKLLDFGLAKPASSRDLDHTQTGEALGTPAFMAPEQFTDFRAVNDRADVYSLGTVIYTALAGRHPYTAQRPNDWLREHERAQPERLPAEIPAPLSALVLRCLAKSPDDRPSAAELARSLTAIADELRAPSAREIAAIAIDRARDAVTLESPAREQLGS
jgi:hypothetical protein